MTTTPARIYLPGMGGSALDWSEVIAKCPGQVVQYPIGSSHETMEAFISSLVNQSFITQAEVMCGYSMGGRIAILLAASGKLPKLKHLVLASAGLGFATNKEREDRKKWDKSWADLFDQNPALFWQKWYQQDIFKGYASLSPSKRAQWESQRSQIKPEQMHRDLLTLSPANHPYLLDSLHKLAQAGLKIDYLAGSIDKKYVEIAKMLEQKGIGRVKVVAEKGHILPLESPEELVNIILS